MKKSTPPYHNLTTMTVASYVMELTKLSGRKLAKRLGIHHKSWQRYLDGSRKPKRSVKEALTEMMQMDSYNALVKAAIEHFAKSSKI